MGTEIHPLVKLLAESESKWGGSNSKLIYYGDKEAASQVIRKWLEERAEEYSPGTPCVRLEKIFGFTPPEKSLEQKIEEALADHAGHLAGAAKIAADIARNHYEAK